jgi:heat shock protein HtpX
MVRAINNVKTAVLLAGMIALFVGVGSMWGQQGMILGLLLGGAMNIVAWFFSDKLAIASMRARELDERSGGDVYQIVKELSQRAGLPMPKVYLCPHEAPNAFATGRSPSKAAVAVTQGLLNIVNRQELEGVIAHELAHIKNRDMLLQTMAATMAGAISNLAQFAFFFGGRGDDEEGGNPLVAIAMLIIGPIVAMVIQFAISRQREFKADAVGAEICGRPLALASALQRLEAGARRIPMQVSPSAASLAIVNPLAAFSLRGAAKWFSTHPPTAERVAALEAIARG